ncbi:NAD(P)/FAD-dependent oxidoreductase [Hoyosella rhizosphaerae]|uniref:FAD-dependent oxidoreductase n=1 Tax=Hoyosella rhizosphaerae TaxID=1755582 RepID=A0A916UFF1_9ACTN|nr:NAD(P)/FAD-dependent oxidoreductase [Hoyosella rhizosphaerae]MBN4927926.1 NAD(P)/FAD-dependent oxidoreductase [Hoyosella rhizosphaerae]GGC71044.1 FAD-dependent oxidoreductase [Hoyosella rhizosphaerae]
MGDAIVIGSGHNALVSACFLAREGWNVQVLERDTVIGGAVSTVERFPGHKVDRGSSAHLMIRHSGIIEELNLSNFGLSYIDCDPWAFAPTEPGSARPGIVFWRDIDDTCASIANACGASEARAYRRFVDVWGPRSKKVMQAFSLPPSPRNLIRSFWGLDTGGDPAELSRSFMASGDALLDEFFTDEHLKAALAWFGAQSGPPMSEPGSAPMVGFAALMHSLPPGRAVGGSGALTVALAQRLRSDGGHIVSGDGAVSVERFGKEWVVTTESGRRFQAPVVIAGCHVLTTIGLLANGGFDDERLDQWKRRIRVGSGLGMAVRLRTSALPQYPSAADNADAVLSSLQLLTTDRAHLRRSHGAMLAGDLPERPVTLAMSFSAIDPTLVPAGEHQITLWSQWHPFNPAASWEDAGDDAADRIVAELERYAPGFESSVLDRYVQTPQALQDELGLIGGNVMHVEMSLDQMMLWRPASALSQHRVPGAPGMYLTGASTHPGGGVSGFSGRSAARLALEDARLGAMRRRFAWPA